MDIYSVVRQGDKLCYGHTDKITITLPIKDHNGNWIRFIGIDSLDDYPETEQVCIAGLKQAAFEAFIYKFGKQFDVIHFWKCPLIADLTPLESLPKLKYVTYYL